MPYSVASFFSVYQVNTNTVFTGNPSKERIEAVKKNETIVMKFNKRGIAQIQLPDPQDDDTHPYLLLEGRRVHAGDCFTALFPDGWHEITLEIAWEPVGPYCWYIANPGYRGVCPIGLFVKV